MATLQTTLLVNELAEVALESWYLFLSILKPNDIGPHVGPTSASIVWSWSSLSPSARHIAQKCLNLIIFELAPDLGRALDQVVDLVGIPELQAAERKLLELRAVWRPKDHLCQILQRSGSDNVTVSIQALRELKAFMLGEHKDYARSLATGDVFDPLVGQILSALFAAASRDNDGVDTLRLLALECLGVLGAVDPDRCEIDARDRRMIMLSNFADESESITFALHLITDMLVGAFRSTSDIRYQTHLAYAIQELLKFCHFTPALVTAGAASATIKVRNRWTALPKNVLETVTPLLEGRFTLARNPLPEIAYPIYPNHSTYREWIQTWTSHLIVSAAGPTAQTIFGVFLWAVRNKDAGVAYHLLPHLVLNILISGQDGDVEHIRSELLAVLEDQINPESRFSHDMKLLSAQAN